MDSSVQQLREMSDPKHFCHQATQAKLLALLKKEFIEPSADGSSLRDSIQSMPDYAGPESFPPEVAYLMAK